jgi:predicted choloylglycine hydrolase
MRTNLTTIAGGQDDFTFVRHLRVEGTQREIGRALAHAASLAHGAAAAPRVVDDPERERVRRRWFATHYPAHLERSNGVADHFDRDPDDTGVTFDWVSTYDTPAGCSVGFYPPAVTKDGAGVLARNFDFPTAPFSAIVGSAALHGERALAADPWVIELHPDEGYASIVVAIMDVMGAMDGINEAGLAVALLADNETPDPEPTRTPRVGLAEQQVVRYLLDSCATVEEAKTALLLAKHYYAFTPCHYVVADRSGASFVWEHSPRRNQEVIVEADRGSDGRIVCTNHLMHRWPDPSQLPVETGPFGTAALTYRRWETLHAAMDRGAIVDRDDIRDHLTSVRFEAPVEGARTFWQALYDVDGASVDVSFYVDDVDGRSRYTDPILLTLAEH